MTVQRHETKQRILSQTDKILGRLGAPGKGKGPAKSTDHYLDFAITRFMLPRLDLLRDDTYFFLRIHVSP